MLMSLFQVGLGSQGTAPDLAGFGGAMIVIFVIISIIGIAVGIMNLINIYHWGMAEKAAFEKAGETKKKWFINLLIVPMVSGLIMIIPILGWIVGCIGYIYSFVLILIYFFSIRKKIGIV